MWCTLISSLLFVVLFLSYSRQADVITFATSRVVVGDGRIIGHKACRAVHRLSRVFVANTKATPMVVSGVITVSVIEVRCPLRPIAIAVGSENVDLVGD